MTHDNRTEGACDQKDELLIAPAAIIFDVAFAGSILFASIQIFRTPQLFQDAHASQY
jgi:hypothetical protein